jgi:NAD(P)-dependent dehydrogenase (short-subunit alcohol dehydrogenase family)
MMKKQFGRIIVFGGTRTNSINGFRTNSVYGGAKTALCSLVKSVAAEYGKYGITCNGILPGFIETEYLSEETKLMLAKKMPQGKLIGAESIAETALFLLKQDAVNGVLLNVDEGWMP